MMEVVDVSRPVKLGDDSVQIPEVESPSFNHSRVAHDDQLIASGLRRVRKGV
jgi:hypothetical protein